MNKKLKLFLSVVVPIPIFLMLFGESGIIGVIVNALLQVKISINEYTEELRRKVRIPIIKDDCDCILV